LSRYFERAHTGTGKIEMEETSGSLVALSEREPPEAVVGFIGTYLEAARLLGQRTGELHLALASEPNDRDFALEPFTPFYQRALYQSMRNLAVRSLHLLKRSLGHLDEDIRPGAAKVAALESEILARLRAIHENPISAKRIRCLGDFHLGQVLYTGKDFVFTDLEGETTRPLGERRIKRSPLRDVASMIRSFDYATHAALFRQIELGSLHEEQLAELEPWAVFWHRWVSAGFLRAYLAVLKPTDLLPAARSQVEVLLDAYLLEKAIHEVVYELNNRPDWVKIPLRGILQTFEREKVLAASGS
jgi:maltose alpha-D-glucosyltransferase/alpha-amylase